MDVGAVIVIGLVHGRIERVDSASVLLHGFVEGPFVVDAERIDRAIAGPGRHLCIDAHRLLPVQSRRFAHHPTAQVVG